MIASMRNWRLPNEEIGRTQSQAFENAIRVKVLQATGD